MKVGTQAVCAIDFRFEVKSDLGGFLEVPFVRREKRTSGKQRTKQFTSTRAGRVLPD